VIPCPKCGKENPTEARFCMTCAAPLAAAAPARETRKTVTVVFCDVTGSTGLGEKLDPESLRKVMSRYFAEMKAALEYHGGTVEKFIGDAVMAVFGIPQVHEDDALRAVRAAAEMQEALKALNKELERDRGVAISARIGVNTGEVVAGDPTGGQALVTGDAVNVAARLEQAAGAGEVLIGEATYRLVRDAVDVEPVEPLELKGKERPVGAFHLLEVVPGAFVHAPRLYSPMIGRELPLRLLSGALDAALAEEACQLVTVLGTAGVGKSRLVEEFSSAAAGRARTLHGRCLPYGEGITYFAALEVVRQATGLYDFDAPEETRGKLLAVLEGEEHADLVCSRLSQLLGLSDAEAASEETFWAIRRFLEAVARERALVVVFEDVHWAEPTFLDLVEHVAEWSREAPILLVCTARPELLDERPGWAGDKPSTKTIPLEPLDEQESERLVENLLGSAELGAGIPTRIAEAAEGNPLFVEEMLSMLIDDGLLVRSDGRWVAACDLSAVPVPPTIRAVLAARLDRLAPSERGAIERASVVGKGFSLGAVSALSPEGVRSEVAREIAALVRKDLLVPERSTLPGEESFRFRHVLIRDVAYEGLPKELRAELHERFADWFEGVAGERIAEQEEIAGYHLEQACRLRLELGPVDERGRELAGRAAERLAAAGRRAFARGDMRATVNLLSRANGLLPEDDPARPALAPDLGRALAEIGELPSADALLVRAIALASELGERSPEAHARLALLDVRERADPRAWREISSVTEAVIPVFEELGDDRGLARAWYMRAFIEEDSPACFERAAEHARRAGDQRLAMECRYWILCRNLFDDATPLSEIERRTEEFRRKVEQAGAGREPEAWVFDLRGHTDSLRGRHDAARDAFRSCFGIFEELGRTYWATRWVTCSAMAEMEAGDLTAAERLLHEGFEALERMGGRGERASLALNLAEVLYRQGRYEEARRHALEAERDDPEDDDLAAWSALCRAKVLAQQGERDAAERLVRDAAATLAEGWASHVHLGSLPFGRLDLAEVFRLCGKTEEATAIASEALALYERKEADSMAARARAFLEDLAR